MARFSATVIPSTQPESWRSSGMTPTPAAAIAPGRPVGTATPATSTVPSSSFVNDDSTSASSRCPLPSTPATPTISPAPTTTSSATSLGAPSRPRTDAPRMRSAGTGSAATVDTTSGATPWTASARPNAAASARNETSRPTIARASVRASASAAGRCSTTRPWRMIEITSVACRTSSSLWLTSATVRPSSATTRRSTENSCSLSAGVRTRGGLVEDEDRRVAPQALHDLHPLALPGRQRSDAGVGVDVEAVVLADLRARARAPRTGRAGPAHRARRSPRPTGRPRASSAGGPWRCRGRRPRAGR